MRNTGLDHFRIGKNTGGIFFFSEMRFMVGFLFSNVRVLE